MASIEEEGRRYMAENHNTGSPVVRGEIPRERLDFRERNEESKKGPRNYLTQDSAKAKFPHSDAKGGSNNPYNSMLPPIPSLSQNNQLLVTRNIDLNASSRSALVGVNSQAIVYGGNAISSVPANNNRRQT